MKICLGMVALAAVAFTLPVTAQTNQPTGRGTLRAACSTDAQKLCANAPKGKGQLRGCLREHQNELSDDCRSALTAQPKG